MWGTMVQWGEERRENLKPDEVVKLFKETSIPGIEELVERIGRRYRRLKRRKPGAKGAIELEVKRVELVYNILRDTLKRISQLPRTSDMDEFHSSLVKEIYGEEYDKAIERARYLMRILDKLWDDYRLLIVTSESPREAARLRKEASGRMLSLWRRYKRQLEVIRRVRGEIIKTHVVSEDLPVIVVAGVPSAGKSTLIRRVSTAEPEVASYPFTTKTIIVGKMRCGMLDAYIVDTPGILDRPFDELNEIERKAYVALRSLAHAVIFLLDPSIEKTVELDGQLRLLRQIREGLARGKPLLVAINKVDVVPSNVVRDIEEKLANMGFEKVYRISALRGDGVDELIEDACKVALDAYLSSSGQALQALNGKASQVRPQGHNVRP